MIAEFNLNDVWRTKNSLRSQYTWRRKDSSQKSRIDYWLINEDILPTVRSCDIRPAMIQTTDHMAISITLTLNTKRGPGSWKFNNSLLEVITFVNDLNEFIDISSVKLKNSHTDPRLIWELLKIEIKSRTITFSKRKAKQCSLNLKHTELELKNTQEIADSYPNIPPDVADKIKKLTQEVESIYAHKAKGAMIRSRTQIIDENEKCTKYFLGLEKSRQSRKLLQTLQVDGHLLTNTDDILNTEADFYDSLYTSSTSNLEEVENYLEDVEIPVLDETSSRLCDGYLSANECYTSLKEMKLNKSPGSDGLTVEFYRKFWPKIGDLLVNSLNHSYEKGELSSSQKHSILSLIYKKGDPNNIENWRPISLLSIDYKIATRCLSKRLQQVLPKLISMDQPRCIKKQKYLL